MAAVSFLPKAIEHVKKALEEDERENYPEAFRLYSLALEYFMTALKCTNPLPRFLLLSSSLNCCLYYFSC